MGLSRNSTPFFGAAAFCTTKIDRFRARAIDHSVLFYDGSHKPKNVNFKKVGFELSSTLITLWVKDTKAQVFLVQICSQASKASMHQNLKILFLIQLICRMDITGILQIKKTKFDWT